MLTCKWLTCLLACLLALSQILSVAKRFTPLTWSFNPSSDLSLLIEWSVCQHENSERATISISQCSGLIWLIHGSIWSWWGREMSGVFASTNGLQICRNVFPFFLSFKKKLSVRRKLPQNKFWFRTSTQNSFMLILILKKKEKNVSQANDGLRVDMAWNRRVEYWATC